MLCLGNMLRCVFCWKYHCTLCLGSNLQAMWRPKVATAAARWVLQLIFRAQGLEEQNVQLMAQLQNMQQNDAKHTNQLQEMQQNNDLAQKEISKHVAQLLDAQQRHAKCQEESKVCVFLG